MSIIKLLPLESAKGFNCRSKEIYQLRNLEDGRHELMPFKKIVLRGNLQDYLINNESILCYIVEEDEIRENVDGIKGKVVECTGEKELGGLILFEYEKEPKKPENLGPVKAKTRTH